MLSELMMGRTAAQIAEQRSRTLGTTTSQIAAVLHKLEVRSRSEAVALALAAIGCDSSVFLRELSSVSVDDSRREAA